MQVAESIDFMIPDFLKKADEDHFTEVALNAAPPNIDTSPGQMYYGHTKPAAIIADEVTQFYMPIAIQMMFPQFATGEFLEWHGRPYRIYRRAATKATGLVQLNSEKEGQDIPAGLSLYTLGDDIESAKEYKTTENVSIKNGAAVVHVEAVDPGVIGNTAARSIVVAENGYHLDNVINPGMITGGTDAEDDELLRERILNRIGLAPLSGAKRDYARWAKEVDGVGDVIVQPLWAGPQTTRVLVTDTNNEVANEDLIRRVKEYIDPAEKEGQGDGQAPIGAIVTVDTIKLVPVKIAAHIYFQRDADPELTIERITRNINNSWRTAPVIRKAEVGAAIIATDGVLDYRDLTLNDQSANIELSESQRAVVSEVVNNVSGHTY